jgi:predicted NUDIX family NTP pyrophosphohydrolase
MDHRTQSAGLLMYRRRGRDIEVFLCRPFVIDEQKKQYWGIPKGRIDQGESPEEAAKREFFEETGLIPPNVPRYYLGKVQYPSGKKEVSVWTFEFDPPEDFVFKSNYTKSKDSEGKTVIIPEIGEWAWFDISKATKSIMLSQREILSRFIRFIGKNNNTYGKKGNDEIGGKGDGKDRLQVLPRFSDTI